MEPLLFKSINCLPYFQDNFKINDAYFKGIQRQPSFQENIKP